MKVILKYSLYRRQKPTNEVKANGFLPQGSVIEVEEIVQGNSIDNISSWHKATDGFYYWGGGMVENEAFKGVDYTSVLKKIDPLLLKNNGENVTIAIIDGGVVFDNRFFDSEKVHTVNIDNGSITSDHGTFIAGIIAGKNSILGIASKANIISLKYKSDNTSIKDILKNLIAALNMVIEMPGVVVVNLSQGFPDFVLKNNLAEKQQIIDCVNKITQAGNKYLVCSAGDNKILTNNVLFPASLDECISIGCVNDFNKDIQLSSKFKLLSPMNNYSSFDLSFNTKKEAGSSFPTAIISGLTACMLSANLNSNIPLTVTDVINNLKKYSTPKSTFVFDELRQFQFQTL